MFASKEEAAKVIHPIVNRFRTEVRQAMIDHCAGNPEMALELLRLTAISAVTRLAGLGSLGQPVSEADVREIAIGLCEFLLECFKSPDPREAS